MNDFDFVFTAVSSAEVFSTENMITPSRTGISRVALHSKTVIDYEGYQTGFIRFDDTCINGVDVYIDVDGLYGYEGTRTNVNGLFGSILPGVLNDWTVSEIAYFAEFEMPNSTIVDGVIDAFEFVDVPYKGLPQVSTKPYKHAIYQLNGRPQIAIMNHSAKLRKMGYTIDKSLLRIEWMMNVTDVDISRSFHTVSIQERVNDLMEPISRYRFASASVAYERVRSSKMTDKADLLMFLRVFERLSNEEISSFVGEVKYRNIISRISNSKLAVIKCSGESQTISKVSAERQLELNEKRYLTIKDTAEYIGFSERKIRDLIRDGSMPYHPLLKVIPREQIDYMIEEGLLNPVSLNPKRRVAV